MQWKLAGLIFELKGSAAKGGQVPFYKLGDHVVGIKQNFGRG